MALILLEGFDLYNAGGDLTKRGWIPGTASYGLTSGRFGGQALRMNNGNDTPLKIPMTSDDTFSIGFAMRTSNIGAHNANGSDFLQLMNGSTVIMRIGVTSNGHIRIGRGDYTTNLIAGSAAAVVKTNSWDYYELEITRNSSTGAINIYQNSTLVASATGANTGASSIDAIAFNGGVDNKDIDDLYIANAATKVGELRIETIRPSADTATKQFARSTGSDNYANVDDTLIDDDGTYNSSDTVSEKDLFDLANLAAAPSAVIAVNLLLTARKDDVATREIRTNMKNGSTTTNGTTRGLSTSYQTFSNIYELNPDDSAAFDGTDINSMQLGYEVVT